MKSAIIFGVLSFFVIFGVTFFLTGVFQGVMTVVEEKKAEEEVEEVPDELALERKSLQARTDDISRREGAIEDLEESLELERAVLGEEFNKIDAMRRRIDMAVNRVEEQKLKSLKKLAKVYEAMPAKDAASILSGMDVDIVLEVVRNMKERPAAKILAALDPARAAAISNLLSDQREN
jgi:flagellar motility protein MotE (MotC chaperone)